MTARCKTLTRLHAFFKPRAVLVFVQRTEEVCHGVKRESDDEYDVDTAVLCSDWRVSLTHASW
jgi:hypothetical protein